MLPFLNPPKPPSKPAILEPVAQLHHFYETHSDYRCAVKYLYLGKPAGTGWLELVHPAHDNDPRMHRLKIAYHLDLGNDTYSYTHSGKITLEVWPQQKMYDRLTTDGFYLPDARPYEGNVQFPLELAAGVVPKPFQIKGFTKNTSTTGLTDYRAIVQDPKGPVEWRLVLGKDGRLMMAEYRKKGSVPWSGYTASNYSLSPDKSQQFDTRPPINYYQYGFDHMLSALSTGQTIPDLGIHRGSKTVSIWKAIGTGKVLVVFLGDRLYPGLKSSLNRLHKLTPIVILSRSRIKDADPFLNYTGSSQTFDGLGIGAFPMFYLVKDHKLIQAWRGFNRRNPSKFESEVRLLYAGHIIKQD